MFPRAGDAFVRRPVGFTETRRSLLATWGSGEGGLSWSQAGRSEAQSSPKLGVQQSPADQSLLAKGAAPCLSVVSRKTSKTSYLSDPHGHGSAEHMWPLILGSGRRYHVGFCVLHLRGECSSVCIGTCVCVCVCFFVVCIELCFHNLRERERVLR